MKKFYYPRKNQMLCGIGLSAVAVLFSAGCTSVPAPLEQMAVSRVALKSAASAGGNEFAPVQLRSAMDKMEGAERAMVQENYLQARQLAEQAQVDAQLAAAASRAAKAEKAASALQKGNQILRQEIDRSTQ
ncbi:MAG: DUF4398 domain-containing protein [Methylovulum sp.]|nr:DUF4398 domain-containing protein [Methylovulum sp.]